VLQPAAVYGYLLLKTSLKYNDNNFFANFNPQKATSLSTLIMENLWVKIFIKKMKIAEYP